MNRFQRWLVWSSSVATGATGLMYWWMKNRMKPVDAWAAINHPLQPWVLKAHILVAPVMVFAVGLIAAEHIWRHYRQNVKAGRRSGLAAMWVFVPMVLSGYLIQAVTHVGLLQAMVWIHLGTGAVYLLGMAAHSRVCRQALARRARGKGVGAPVAAPSAPHRPNQYVAFTWKTLVGSPSRMADGALPKSKSPTVS